MKAEIDPENLDPPIEQGLIFLSGNGRKQMVAIGSGAALA